MSSPEITYGASADDILSALRAARKATGKSQETVAKELGVAPGTIGNYENLEGRGGRWMNPIKYLRFLVEQSDQGRELVLGLLGLEPVKEVRDPQLADVCGWFERARYEPGWDHLYWVLHKTFGDGDSAPSEHGAGERLSGEQPAAASQAPNRGS